MRHLRPQFAMLAGAFALAVLASLFASSRALYQKLSLAAHALVPAGAGRISRSQARARGKSKS